MGKLTQKEKEYYLENNGVCCLYCGSDNIDAIENVQVDGGIGTQGVECLDCGEDWTDIYRLINVNH